MDNTIDVLAMVAELVSLDIGMVPSTCTGDPCLECS
jgi:hypothetical protein